MYEYSYNVALNGRHLFRTDWYMVEVEADAIEAALVRKFTGSEGYRVSRQRRNVTQQSWDITQPGDTPTDTAEA